MKDDIAMPNIKQAANLILTTRLLSPLVALGVAE